MLQVPEIRAPDEDDDDGSSSSGQRLQVPQFSLLAPPDDPPDGGGCCVTLQVPEMGTYVPSGSSISSSATRLEPPKTLHLSLPPFPQPGMGLLQVPGGYVGPRRRHSWICR
ncbi:hypothetical protein E2C01_064311 [Portunus trituberculatus]|uniref:Uncharacterized protein n=1 Tax=Portunus trituberculatus TaxID=210409 RepID=A0A5B7HNF3_PORTR|nr:hypothetical protein [Portunus trituberculatus]